VNAPRARKSSITSEEGRAGLLTIQCSDQLSAIHILQRDHRDVQVGHQHVTGPWGVSEGADATGCHRAAAITKFDFDLDLDATAAHQQFWFSPASAADACVWKSSLLQSIGGLPECRP